MSRYLTESLSSGETLIHDFRPHWSNWVEVFAAAIFIITIPYAIYTAIRLATIEWGVTDRRIVHKRGWIARHSDEMNVSSVETVEIQQSAFGRIMGFGTVTVTGRGVSDVSSKAVDDPLTVKRAIESVVANPSAAGSSVDGGGLSGGIPVTVELSPEMARHLNRHVAVSGQPPEAILVGILSAGLSRTPPR